MYGNTENMANVLANTFAEKGIKNIRVYDVSHTDLSQLISESFKYSNIVLASPTYNGEMYPVMKSFVTDMKDLNLQNRTIAVMDNGTWGAMAGKKIVAILSEMKNITVIEKVFSVKSTLKTGQEKEFTEFADTIIQTM